MLLKLEIRTKNIEHTELSTDYDVDIIYTIWPDLESAGVSYSYLKE